MSGRAKVWVVRPTDPKTLLEILVRAGDDLSAIEDGRVFIGKKRATKDQPVHAGDSIQIGPRVASPTIEILFEKDDIIACVKPAGLPTVPDHAGSAHSLVALVEKQLGPRLLRVTSRLDRDVSGVVLFAVGAAAEARLAEARAAGEYRRRYVAIALGHASTTTEGVWNTPIGRAKNPLLRVANGMDAKDATTRWRIAGSTADALLLAVDPETGRTHQIRVHAAHAGWPLLGDRDYGPGRATLANGAVLAPSRVALHAARVEVAGLRAEAPIPKDLESLWQSCGGPSTAWSAALGQRF